MKIFLIGFMGSGKTHWGRQLAAKLQLEFYDLDETIVNAENKSVVKIFESEGEEYFRRKEKEVLEQLSDAKKAFVLSCGGGTPCYFNNIDFMKREGTVVWLNTSTDVLYNRLLKEKSKRPLLANISDEDLKAYIRKKINERRLYYEQADVIIQEEEATLDSLIQSVLHA